MSWAWLWWLVPLAVLALVLILALLLRARALYRVVGSFACALREAENQHWVNGVAVYGVGRLDWYGLPSLSPRPRYRWPRRELILVPVRRSLTGAPPAAVEVTCRLNGDEFHLALAGAALDGLTSWLESSPPIERGLA